MFEISLVTQQPCTRELCITYVKVGTILQQEIREIWWVSMINSNLFRVVAQNVNTNLHLTSLEQNIFHD